MQLEFTNWITIPVDNRQRACHFYYQVFQLSAVESVDTNIAYFPDTTNGGYCGSMLERSPDNQELRPSLIYIYAFGDVDEIADRVMAAGGRILSAKTDLYPKEGVFIIFEDTEANKVAFVGIRASQSQKNTA